MRTKRFGLPGMALISMLFLRLTAAQAETTPPTCQVTGFAPTQVTVQDTGSGLRQINVLPHTRNFAVGVPSFSVGTTNPVVVTATLLPLTVPDVNGNPAGSVPDTGTLELEIIDVDGNVIVCEIDHFPNSKARVTINSPFFGSDTVTLVGPATVLVRFLGRDGKAADLNGNGLDEVPTELVQLDLSGTGKVLGHVTLRLRDPTKDPFKRSTGQIEELFNAHAGRLDIPPFTPSGECPNGCKASSFFDVFFEVTALGVTLHNDDFGGLFHHLLAKITQKPPGSGERYETPTNAPPITLFTDIDQGHTPLATIADSSHTPNLEIINGRIQPFNICILGCFTYHQPVKIPKVLLDAGLNPPSGPCIGHYGPGQSCGTDYPIFFQIQNNSTDGAIIVTAFLEVVGLGGPSCTPPACSVVGFGGVGARIPVNVGPTGLAPGAISRPQKISIRLTDHTPPGGERFFVFVNVVGVAVEDP